jgi:hypothetical protein
MLEGFGAVLAVATMLSIAALTAPVAHPSAQLFNDLTQVGTGLFVAFSIAIAGVGIRVGEDVAEHLNWLGNGCGVGIAGLIAIGAGVALAAYRGAHHVGSLDVIGLCWIVAALLMMGVLVAVLPYAAFVWSRPPTD